MIPEVRKLVIRDVKTEMDKKTKKMPVLPGTPENLQSQTLIQHSLRSINHSPILSIREDQKRFEYQESLMPSLKKKNLRIKLNVNGKETER